MRSNEFRAVVAGCASAGVPTTIRGSGGANRGQCMLLHGAVFLGAVGPQHAARSSMEKRV